MTGLVVLSVLVVFFIGIALGDCIGSRTLQPYDEVVERARALAREAAAQSLLKKTRKTKKV